MSTRAFVVVTGADGFIGQALVAHFGVTGRSFRAVVRRPGHAAPLPLRYTSVTDLATLSDAELDTLVAGTAAIVHLAGRAHVRDESAPDPDPLYRLANVVATERLAQAAVRAGVERFIYASSVKVNGEASLPGRAFRPDDPPAPHDAYARSKLDAEQALAAVCAGTATVPLVLRLPLVYGPGVKANFLTLIDEIARRRVLPLGAVHNRRSLLYVGNLVDAIDAALDASPAPAGVHFLADADAVSVPDLVRALAAAVGVDARLTSVPLPLLKLGGRVLGKSATIDRLTGSLEVDTASFRSATGWSPRHSRAEGLAATAAWWRTRHAL
ncbi:MAG: NAD-dependent epimerase/dehydratase family protein [Betaproteobacteria bacterium]